ncbi:hypothetical protein [Paenibacillus sp. FSL W8-0194]|uniref:hypothetical protein n=1 Tax=Paenibacillus sp. FSL W8-0194 TaxID=2921711 RepID=UPI0030DB1CEB
MKKKTAIVGVLSLALATTAVTAWASQGGKEGLGASESNVVIQPNNNPVSDDRIVNPFIVDKEWSTPMTSGSGSSARDYFTVNPRNGYLELHLANYSNSPVRVTLTHIDTGYVYYDKTVDPSSSKDYFSWLEGAPQGLRTGSYLIQYIGGANPVNGEYWGKLASSKTDF